MFIPRFYARKVVRRGGCNMTGGVRWVCSLKFYLALYQSNASIDYVTNWRFRNCRAVAQKEQAEVSL